MFIVDRLTTNFNYKNESLFEFYKNSGRSGCYSSDSGAQGVRETKKNSDISGSELKTGVYYARKFLHIFVARLSVIVKHSATCTIRKTAVE